MVEERGGVVEDHDIDAVDPEPTHERGGQVRHVSERGGGRSWFTHGVFCCRDDRGSVT
jgi:hypothetical protein